MPKQYQVIEIDHQKWLRPINPHTEKLTLDWCAIPASYYNPEWQQFNKTSVDILYIGGRELGDIVKESEVREIRQYQTTEFGSLTWYTADDEDEINRWRERNPDGLKTRTAYTDSEPHDRHISESES